MKKTSTNKPYRPKTSFFTKKIPITWFITTALVAVISLSMEIGSAFSHSNNAGAKPSIIPNASPLNNSTAENPQNTASPDFTNPIIACRGPILEIRPFKNQIKEIVDEIIGRGEANNISIAFRSLNNGYAFGINSEQKFRPASLLKVPTMIAYLKLAEDSPAILDRKILFAKSQQIGIPNNIPNPMIVGQSYTIRELIERMIENSDNDAAMLLLKGIDDKEVEKTYAVFDLNVPKMLRPDQDFSSVSDFVRIFRILYNASYLNKEMSDYALNMLSKVYFADGIVGGVGNGTPVAHKYGEWYFNGVYQLHDCGIVYVQGNPYIVAIMTKGIELKKLSGVIRRISNVIYSHVQVDLQS